MTSTQGTPSNGSKTRGESKTQSSVADTDPNSIEAFAKRLVGSGFVVSERGKDARAPTMQEAMLIAHAAQKYDLDPLMGEVSVLGAKLYTTLPGVRKSARKAAAAQGRRYSERTRPATRPEYEAAACGDKEHYWICDVVIDGGDDSFVGHGFASADNVPIAAIWRDRQLVGYDPRVIRNMAENRAVRRALVAAFGLPFADPDDGDREGMPQVPATATAPVGSPNAHTVYRAHAGRGISSKLSRSRQSLPGRIAARRSQVRVVISGIRCRRPAAGSFGSGNVPSTSPHGRSACCSGW